MKSSYSFLSDEMALIEIRKHKWIESQKAKKEIGFATAALNWIKKYGNDWEKYRLNIGDSQNIFEEKRRYRRFAYNAPLTIRTNDRHISAYTNDINLVGLSCTLPITPQEGSSLEVTLTLKEEKTSAKKPSLQFSSRVIRATLTEDKHNTSFCRVVLSFAEDVRDYLRFNANLFAAA